MSIIKNTYFVENTRITYITIHEQADASNEFFADDHAVRFRPVKRLYIQFLFTSFYLARACQNVYIPIFVHNFLIL